VGILQGTRAAPERSDKSVLRCTWDWMPNPPRHRKGGRVDPRDLPKGPNGRCLCRQCGIEVQPPRITFCSKACVDEWTVQTGTRVVLRIRRRDRGRCALCGLDCEALRRELKKLRGKAADAFRAKHGIPRHRKGRLWDIDHIVPVAEGGGSCGLDGLRSVCIPCHARITKELMARLRARA
jgi:hypothetical protein